jgi:hypothetical protein
VPWNPEGASPPPPPPFLYDAMGTWASIRGSGQHWVEAEMAGHRDVKPKMLVL